MQFLRNILIIVLACIIMIPLLTPAVLQVKKLTVQMHMLEQLEKQQLQTVTVAENKIVWIKKGKECLIDGEMFDVKSIQIKNGLAVIKGLFDEKEKQLKKQIEDFAKKEHQSNKAFQFVKLFSAVDHSISIVEIPEAVYTITAKAFGIYHQFQSSPFITITVPPPQT